MRDEDHDNELTDEQLASLRQSLEALEQELRELIAAIREGTRPVDLGEPIGRLTRIDAIQQQHMSSANRREHDLRLRQVRQALSFMDRGRYGICARCEDPIGYRRLSARPESPYCLDCQDEIDRRHSG